MTSNKNRWMRPYVRRRGGHPENPEICVGVAAKGALGILESLLFQIVNCVL
jgi:hypothetical protein